MPQRNQANDVRCKIKNGTLAKPATIKSFGIYENEKDLFISAYDKLTNNEQKAIQ